MPIAYPDNLTPSAAPCICSALNEYWFSLVWGVLADALSRWNWSVTDEQWPAVEQAVMKVMAMANNNQDCGDCIIEIFADGDGQIKGRTAQGNIRAMSDPRNFWGSIII